ncbi:MAG: UDP-N-acetylglucosamine 1-carboxyvinyltransferase [Deltaproteobacteria bacterium]|nr:UDP-N-acetylglucosamine 1-carboxyvinyltransferase [Deltaproteobacteria bacterium]
MDALRIVGGRLLKGGIQVSGSKNASLPILAAALLAEGKSTLRGAPDLADVRTLAELLAHTGARVERGKDGVTIDANAVERPEAPYDLVRTMRASFLLLGPLLARFGRARVSLPGGCAIGARPVDQHLKGLARLGADIHIEHGYVEARAAKLTGAEVVFDMPTVGGTEHLMLAASRARGVSVLRNAAQEPEVVDLARALSAMGARIDGAGSEVIAVHGSDSLRPFDHRVIPDRIEFGTFLVAGAMAGDPLTITGGEPEHQAVLMDKLRESGAGIEMSGSGVRVSRPARARAVDVHTAPYPGFPTDMQAQLMAMLTVAQGTSMIAETIFENRFMHVAELDRLGASIRVEGGRAIVHGVERLSGSTVMATDLRASACLVLAGLVADGETVVRRIYHLDRGYERLGEKLGAVGAHIERFKE